MDTSLDFTVVDTNNCKTIGIVDTSTYQVGQGISAPTLSIQPPGSTVIYTYHFLARKVNIVNSNNIGLTTANNVANLTNLPDGLYNLTYTIHPSTTYSITKTYFRVCKLECRFEKALLKLDVLNCEDLDRERKINKLKEIEFLIMSAVASANVCNHNLALDLYRRAQLELDRLDIKHC